MKQANLRLAFVLMTALTECMRVIAFCQLNAILLTHFANALF